LTIGDLRIDDYGSKSAATDPWTELRVALSEAEGRARACGGGDAVLFIAPRLCSRLVTASHLTPLGGECWKTSRVMLSPGLRDRDFRDVMTGAEIRPTHAGESA
jgi:hypothetical protein